MCYEMWVCYLKCLLVWLMRVCANVPVPFLVGCFTFVMCVVLHICMCVSGCVCMCVASSEMWIAFNLWVKLW